MLSDILNKNMQCNLILFFFSQTGPHILFVDVCVHPEQDYIWMCFDDFIYSNTVERGKNQNA